MKKFNQFSTKTIPVLELKYGIDHLYPAMSSRTVDVHYNILTKNYSKKFAETGDQFQENGIRLHNLWWANLTDKRVNPTPSFVDWISKTYDSWNGFLAEISNVAKILEGNGWIVLRESSSSSYPVLELIHNHDYPRQKIDTILGIWDLWEHAFIYDYPGQRDVYVQKLLMRTDWRVIENRRPQQPLSHK